MTPEPKEIKGDFWQSGFNDDLVLLPEFSGDQEDPSETIQSLVSKVKLSDVELQDLDETLGQSTLVDLDKPEDDEFVALGTQTGVQSRVSS